MVADKDIQAKDDTCKTWTTLSELLFIRNIECYAGDSFLAKHKKEARKELLKRYISAINLRKLWDKIDENAVRHTAEAELAACK